MDYFFAIPFWFQMFSTLLQNIYIRSEHDIKTTRARPSTASQRSSAGSEGSVFVETARNQRKDRLSPSPPLPSPPLFFGRVTCFRVLHCRSLLPAGLIWTTYGTGRCCGFSNRPKADPYPKASPWPLLRGTKINRTSANPSLIPNTNINTFTRPR